MIVYTESELKNAIKRKEKFIQINNKELANKIYKATMLKRYSKVALTTAIGAVIAGVALTPVTGGVSIAGGAGIAALTMTATEITTLVWVVGLLGLSAMALIKGYNVKLTTHGVELTKS